MGIERSIEQKQEQKQAKQDLPQLNRAQRRRLVAVMRHQPYQNKLKEIEARKYEQSILRRESIRKKHEAAHQRALERKAAITKTNEKNS